MKVTEHVPVEVETVESVQVAGAKVPAPVDEKETVPVGVVGEVVMSFTVAVQLVAESTATEAGVQASVVAEVINWNDACWII